MRNTDNGRNPHATPWDYQRECLYQAATRALHRENTAGKPAAMVESLTFVERWLRGTGRADVVNLYIVGTAAWWHDLPQAVRDYLAFCATDPSAVHTIDELLALHPGH